MRKNNFKFITRKISKSVRAFEMFTQEIKAISRSSRLQTKKLRMFNLDLHIGVIADLSSEFKNQQCTIDAWSISWHNHLVPGKLPVPDAVRHVNNWNWRDLNPDRINRFKKRYRLWLNTFDGFICTYPPTFSELFGGLNKPIFIVAATRYETPYTNQPDQWSRFNSFLKSEVNAGLIHLYANNKGDADYLFHFTNLSVKVLPSLCEKFPARWSGSEGQNLILSRDKQLSNMLSIGTQGKYLDISILGNPYKWIDLLNCREILVIPQNISTMSLFEFATAGIPVAIPSKRWIKELKHKGFKVVNELTFHEIEEIPISNKNDIPTNYKSEGYLDWWLERADFYDKKLMPNVRIVDNLNELIDGQTSAEINGSHYSSLIEARNLNIKMVRENAVKNFLSSINAPAC